MSRTGPGVTKGRCLCGAVRLRVTAPMTEISACHCDLCRRWNGSMQMGIAVEAASVTITGPVKTHRSSRIAEPACCDTCGSAVWLRDVDGQWSGHFELVPGLFDNAAGARLAREVYEDRCPAGYALAGDHTRVSRESYEARYPHLSGDE